MRDRIGRIRRRRLTRTTSTGGERLDALETRVSHLETMVEGLQDSVHREVTRMNLELERLHRRTEPAEIARAMSENARAHGL